MYDYEEDRGVLASCLISVIGGSLSGLMTHYLSSNYMIDPEKYKTNKDTKAILEALRYSYGRYPELGSEFRKNTPQQALQRLDELEEIVAKNEDHLAKVGYLNGIRDSLDAAVKAVEDYNTSKWKFDAADWYAWLHGGTNGEEVHAPELKALFAHTEDIRDGVGSLKPDAAVWSTTTSSGVFFALLLGIGSYSLYRKIKEKFDLRSHQKSIRERFNRLSNI